MSVDNVKQLQSMFPDIDKTKIEAVLSENNNDINAAVITLLTLTGSPKSRPQESTTNKEESKQKDGDFNAVLHKVGELSNNKNAKQYAKKYGLKLTTLAIDNNNKSDSSIGDKTHASDMTLIVNNTHLPILRSPNNNEKFTWKVKLENILLIGGNESKKEGDDLYHITLKEYLQQKFPKERHTLYSEGKDTHAIISAQGCILPVPKGNIAKYNVAITNSASVLAITATRHGLSPQIVASHKNVNNRTQILYHNRNGQKTYFFGCEPFE